MARSARLRAIALFMFTDSLIEVRFYLCFKGMRLRFLRTQVIILTYIAMPQISLKLLWHGQIVYLDIEFGLLIFTGIFRVE